MAVGIMPRKLALALAGNVMVLLQTFLLLLAAAGYIGFICRTTATRLATAPFLSICFIVAVLYVFGIAGHLYAGAVLCLALGLLAGLASICLGSSRATAATGN